MIIKQTLFLFLLSWLITSCATAAETAPLLTQPVPAPTIETIPTLLPEIPSVTPGTEPNPTLVTEIETPVSGVDERSSPIDGMTQAYVPAGTLRMGGLDVYADDRDELPAHTVSLGAFWIDKLEVTNAMYMLCVQAGECSAPGDWASGEHDSYFNNEEFKDYPVVNVTWKQATVYCSWAGRRLPTEAEWERAARGDDLRNYPWGDEPPSETYANFNRLVNETSRVGSYAAGASPFGALDMAGNVWEWVADLYEIEYYYYSPDTNPTGPETNGTSLRVIRGGSYQDGWTNLRVSKRGAALGPNPKAPYDNPNRNGEISSKIGFRCGLGD